MNIEGQIITSLDKLCQICYIYSHYYYAIYQKGSLMTEFELGYLAGIIDGEGSIVLDCLQNSIRPTPSISICSTSKELLDYIITITGSRKAYHHRKESKGKNHKRSFQLSWTSLDDIYKICLFIEGKLVIKREQVEIMIAFIKARKAF